MWKRERSDDVPISSILLLFIGHRRPANDQEFGSHQAYAFSATVGRELRFFRQIDVGAERHPMSVEGDGVSGGEGLELLVLESLGLTAVSVRLDLRRCGIHDQDSRCPIENHVLVPHEQFRRIAQTDDRGQSERPREDRDVRRACAGISSDSDDRLAIELHRETGREIVGDENPVRSLWQTDWIVIGQSEEDRQHSDVHVDQIADSLAQERPRVTRELLAPFKEHQIECLLGAEVLSYELLDLSKQLAILENRELDVEDRRFLGTGILFGASPHVTETLARLIQACVEALDFAWYGFVGNDAVAYVRNFPPEKVDESVHDSR